MALLSRDRVLQMQCELLIEYSRPEFQSKLRKIISKDCEGREAIRLGAELRETREMVGARFGFGKSPEGVQESIRQFAGDFLFDPEVMLNCNQINFLLDPELQDDVNAKLQTGKIGKHEKDLVAKARILLKKGLSSGEAEGAMEKAIEEKRQAGADAVGEFWKVLGGERSGGLVVREGKSLLSEELHGRLAAGSIVKKVDRCGDRLLYKLMAGRGPKVGWVSTVVKGVATVGPVVFAEALVDGTSPHSALDGRTRRRGSAPGAVRPEKGPGLGHREREYREKHGAAFDSLDDFVQKTGTPRWHLKRTPAWCMLI